MKKLEEMEAWELMGTLAELAEPVSNLVNDEQLWEDFRKCTAKGVSLKRQEGLLFILKTYGKLGPALLGKHRMDTLRVLAIVKGKRVEELMHMNGTEVLQDFKKVYKEILEPFFIKSVPSGKTE